MSLLVILWFIAGAAVAAAAISSGLTLVLVLHSHRIRALLSSTPTQSAADQIAAVFASAVAPELTRERVEVLLEDLVRQGLLDRRGKVYQPAAAGWEFIESNRIYGNIEPTPLEVALVDADTGAVVVDFRKPFLANVLKGRGGGDGEADQEDIGLGVRQRAKTIVILLSGGIKQTQSVGLITDPEVSRKKLELV